MKTQTTVIVTENLRHVPTEMIEPLNIEARSTDAFVAHTIALDTGKTLAAVRRMRERMKKPERSAGEAPHGQGRKQTHGRHWTAGWSVLGCVHPNTRSAVAESTTLTVRLSAYTKAQLAKLAGSTRRTQSFLGAEAIAAYVQRELAIIDAIERGRADVRADRITDHADVARAARALIKAARPAT